MVNRLGPCKGVLMHFCSQLFIAEPEFTWEILSHVLKKCLHEAQWWLEAPITKLERGPHFDQVKCPEADVVYSQLISLELDIVICFAQTSRRW